MRNRIPGGTTKLEKLKKENHELTQALSNAYRIVAVLVERSPIQPVLLGNEEILLAEGCKLERRTQQGFIELSVVRPAPLDDQAEPQPDTGPESATEVPTEEQSAEPDPVH